MTGLQMASAYTGGTFMPMVFGLIQQKNGNSVMSFYMIVFLLMNYGVPDSMYRKKA